MSNSALATYTNISANKTSPRTGTIDTISIHCVVAQWTAKQTVDYLQPSTRNASCNYAVGKDGSIAIGVDEKDRSWCTSSSSNDHRAITIEVASDTTSPYAVTDVAYNALVKLLVDICQRNSALSGGLKWQGDKDLIGTVSKQNMTVHRWFANKACPGDYLYNLHGQIAADVNALLKTDVAPTEPKVETTNVIAADGDFGKLTVTRTQEFLGTVQDGLVSNQLVSSKEYLINAVASAWEFNNGNGSLMVVALQKFLNKENGSKLSTDGKMGELTIKQLQKFVGTSTDGYMGESTTKAWQTYLNRN